MVLARFRASHSLAARTAAGVLVAGLAGLAPISTARAAPAAGPPVPVPPPAGSEVSGAAARLDPAELARLAAAADAATRAAEEAAAGLTQAAARSVGVRIELDRLASARDGAQQALDTRARRVYEAGRVPDPLGSLLSGLTPADLRIATAGTAAGLGADDAALRRLVAQSARVEALRARAEAARRALLPRALSVYAAADRARALLVRAQQGYAAQQRAAAQAAAARQLAADAARLAALSSTVTDVLATEVGTAGRQVAAEQAPLLRLLAASPGLPAGYSPTGQVLTGISSWYGPGFVGRPTSSGAPYDPELLTAAMLAVPLGTVVRVHVASGRAVNVLVTDHGPYVGDRLIDLSQAAARALGVGLTPVTVEVLAPVS